MISTPQPLDLSSLCLAILEHAPFPMAAMEGPQHIVRHINPAFCRLLDTSAEKLIGLPFCEGLPETDVCLALLDRVLRTGKAESYTEHANSKPSSNFWSFTMWPVMDHDHPAGVIFQVSETAQSHEKTVAMNEALLLGSLRQHELTETADLLNAGLQKEINERKHAEARVTLLVGELAHRGQNQLAVLQSIVSRSLSGSRTLAEAREVLLKRLHALGRTQAVLMSEGFEGVPLASIVQFEVEAFSERFKVDGPIILLKPKVAQTFALIVHELATNASKHGALSNAAGVVEINWLIEGSGPEARFKLRWQERGGPPVIAPTRQGFGRNLLEKAVAQEFGAPPTVTFAPAGLTYEIDASLSAIVAEAREPAAA